MTTTGPTRPVLGAPARLGPEPDGHPEREPHSLTGPVAPRGVADERPPIPRGVLAEVAAELRWIFAERKGWLIGFAFNLVCAGAYVGWSHYSPHRVDDLRVDGIATGIALWVMADVLNTNQLGDDADRVNDLVAHGYGVRRQLSRKNGALLVLLLPLTVLVSFAVRGALGRWGTIPRAVFFDAFVVFTWLGVGDVLSVLIPYRSISLRERMRRPRSWARWGFCLGAPYLVLVVINYLRWPADRIAHHLLGAFDGHAFGYGYIYMCWGFLTWLAGLGLAGLYAGRFGRRLSADLHRPD